MERVRTVLLDTRPERRIIVIRTLTERDNVPARLHRGHWTDGRHPLAVENVLLGCDGTSVFARIDELAETAPLLDALLDAVAAVARWDAGLTASLATLPDASPLASAPLDTGDLRPAVRLADGLVLGVHDRTRLVASLPRAIGAGSARVTAGVITIDGALPAACTAALARAGDGRLIARADGARFTWPAIERDPARHRAAIEALRALAAETPYR